MLEKLLKAKRTTQADLDQAKRRLADLEEQQHFKPVVATSGNVVEKDEPEPRGRVVDGDEYISIQADLSKEADRLNRKMADLSNKLHQVPAGVGCPELTKPILELKAQIEAIWDKKRYLERNRVLPDESDPEEDCTADRNRCDHADHSPEKFELSYQKRRLIDLRSKLRRKLENPKAKPSKRVEWETELTKATLQIDEIEVKLGTL